MKSKSTVLLMVYFCCAFLLGCSLALDHSCSEENEYCPVGMCCVNGQCVDDPDGSNDSDASESCDTIYYNDKDEDDYGDDEDTVTACEPPDGYVDNGDDCNDRNENIHPEATENCNRIDDDCDSIIDNGCDSPESTTLLSPWNGRSTGTVHSSSSLRPYFEWTVVAGTTDYELEVDDSCTVTGFTTCDFLCPEIVENVNGTSFIPLIGRIKNTRNHSTIWKLKWFRLFLTFGTLQRFFKI